MLCRPKKSRKTFWQVTDMWCTQIGGKYHRDDNSVFRVKAKLTALGISVSHPMADEIKATTADHGLAFDPTVLSFSEVERDYYNSIRRSDFHTVCNQFGGQLGYIGESASLEMAYAMCHSRPIVLLHRAQIKPAVDKYIRSILLKRLDRVTIFDLLTTSDYKTMERLALLVRNPVDYDVSNTERRRVEASVTRLLSGLDTETVDATA